MLARDIRAREFDETSLKLTSDPFCFERAIGLFRRKRTRVNRKVEKGRFEAPEHLETSPGLEFYTEIELSCRAPSGLK